MHTHMTEDRGSLMIAVGDWDQESHEEVLSLKVGHLSDKAQ